MEWGCRLRRVFPLALVLLASFLLNLQNLGHPRLTYFDESFHAIVARNLLKHPLKPTLIDDPVIAYNAFNWTENHVWLHKPILALWQIALSYSLLGVNAFALRFPSALLSSGAAFLTFLIGRELFERRTGFIAAAAQAVNPAITCLVRGCLFSDHVDIALLFWVELGIYLLVRAIRSGSWRDLLLAGVAQGLAYLTKSYLAAVISGIAVIAWLLSLVPLGFVGESRIRFRHLVGLAGATLLTVAPWTLYCIAHYPREFFFEHGYVWSHLNSGIEIWGAPWDRVVFDYLIALYDVFYTPVLFAAFAMSWRAFRNRQRSLWIVYAWAVIVLAPHLVAATKTPSATLIGMPAFFLLLGHLISEATRGDRWLLAAWVAIVVVSTVYPAPIRHWGVGYPDPPVFAGVMRQALWVVGHLTAALGTSVAIMVWPRGLRTARGGSLDCGWVVSSRILRQIALAGTIVLGGRCAYASWKVAQENPQGPELSGITAFIREQLPPTAVLLYEGRDLGEHQLVMLLADRPCYALRGRPIESLARQVIERGRIPYILSNVPSLEPALYRSVAGPLAIYDWRMTAQASREDRRAHY